MPEVWEKLRLIPHYLKASPRWDPMMEDIRDDTLEKIFNNPEELVEWGVPQEVADLYTAASHEVIERRHEIWNYMPFHRIVSEDSGYTINPNVNYTLKTKHYGAHCDDTVKCMSLVCYVDPEYSSGTSLHVPYYESDQPGDVVKKVEWKRNRCLIFNPSNVSWHSYTCESDERFVFAMFMKT